MASAFAVFANHGMRTEPFAIRKMEDAEGRILEKHQVVSWRALHERVVEQMVEMLTEVVRSGTAAAQSYLLRKFPVAGKTGTSNEYVDAWFVGFTDDLTAVVWMGNEAVKSTQNRYGKGVSGATLPAPVCARFMAKAQPIMSAARASEEPENIIEIDPGEQGSPEAPEPPETLAAGEPEQPDQGQQAASPTTITKRVCPVSGGIAGPYCPNPAVVTYNVASGEGPPEEQCDIHTSPAPGQPAEPQTEPTPPEPPPTTRRVTLPICAITGEIASPRCPIVVNRTFEADVAPTQTCPRHARPTPGP